VSRFKRLQAPTEASGEPYKSLKWLSGIELTKKPVTGYWEQRGYPKDAIIPAADVAG
jgi:DMSO/TMAO reductase YedYZ molybdopterin-dependent catalytic subunit